MARDAKRATDAAHTQAAIAKQAQDATQRAFIAWRTVDVIPIADTGYTVLRPVMYNSGGGVAQNVLSFVNYLPASGAFKETFSYINLYKVQICEPLSRTYVPPNGQLDLSEWTLSQDLMPDPKTGKRLYVYGWIEYDDSIPKSRRHRTEFCVEIVASIFMNSAGEERRRFNFHRHHRFNGADDDCEHPIMSFEERLAEFRDAQANVRAQEQAPEGPES
jgi:hypothetical protein